MIIFLLAPSLVPPSLSARSGNVQHKSDALPNTILVRLRPGAISIGSAMSVLGHPDISATHALLLPEQTLDFIARRQATMLQVNSEHLTEIRKAEEPLLRTFRVRYEGTKTPEEMAQFLMHSNPEVEIAEPYYLPQLLDTPQDPLVAQQEMLPVIHAFEAWDHYKGDPSMKIAISDSGVNQDHEDLKNSLWTNTGETPNNGIDDDGNGYIDDYQGYDFAYEEDSRQADRGNTISTDPDDHGTKVAGILAATPNNGKGLAGVAYNCKIFPLKIIPNSSGEILYGYESIIYAAVNNFKVLNCSWGGTEYSDIKRSVVEFAVAHDVAIAAGAGNDGLPAPLFPAGYRGVLGVGVSFPATDIVTSESNYGAHLGIITPAEGAWTTANNGSYGTFGATSGATPIASGALALVRGLHPALTALQAVEFLRLCTDNIENKNLPLRGMIPGRLNLLTALTRDPFATPGVMYMGSQMKADDGTVTNRFTVNEIVHPVITIKNVLAAGTNVKCTFSVVNDPLSSIQVQNTTVTIPSIDANQTTTFEGFTFKIMQEYALPVFLRVDITANNGYKDYFLIPFTPTTNYTIFQDDVVALSAIDEGQLGYNDENHLEGVGFQYKPYGNLLFEGGIMAVDGSGQVASAARSKNKGLIDQDFSVLKPFAEPLRTQSRIVDNNLPVEKQIGLTITQNFSIPSQSSSFIFDSISIENTSGKTLNDVAVGYFLDFDIGLYGDSNKIALRQNGTIPYFNNAAIAWGECWREGPYPVVACGSYSNYPGAIPQFAGFDNDPSVSGTPFGTTEGFSESDKIRSLTGGVSLQYQGMGDVGCVTGMLFPGAWPSGEKRLFIVLLGAADTKEHLESAFQLFTPVPEEVDKEFSLHLSPLPAHSFVTLCGTLPYSAEITMHIVNLLGKEVLPPSRVFANKGAIALPLSVSNLPVGIYILQVDFPHRRQSLPLIIVH